MDNKVIDGIMYNRLGRVVSPSLMSEKDLWHLVDMELHNEAYEKYCSMTISLYTKMREEHGYSDEEMFEMKANLGDGPVVDVFTGKRIY